MTGNGTRRGLRFLLQPTLGWGVGLTFLAFAYQVLAGAPAGDDWALWDVLRNLPGSLGLLLPFSSFAGGVAVKDLARRRTVWGSALLVAASAYFLLAFVSPLAEHHTRARQGGNLAVEYPTGPLTPSGLRALRTVVLADPPTEYSHEAGQPLQKPPNWLTYLIHSLVAMACFTFLAVRLGQRVGVLTSGIPPPKRQNVRWALGLASGVAFMAAVGWGGDWVRADPSHSGIAGAWLPLFVPIVELALIALFARARADRLHGSPRQGV